MVRDVNISSTSNNRADSRGAEEKHSTEKIYIREINFFYPNCIIYYYHLSKPREPYRCYIKYRVHRGSKHDTSGTAYLNSKHRKYSVAMWEYAIQERKNVFLFCATKKQTFQRGGFLLFLPWLARLVGLPNGRVAANESPGHTDDGKVVRDFKLKSTVREV